MSHAAAGPLTPAQIWRDMTADERLAAAQALWSDPDSSPQQADALQAIARQLRFRPRSVLKLTPERLAHHLAALRAVSESLASRALVVYHLTSQRPMLEAFLDHLGVAHEQGLIAESSKPLPDADRLREAVAALLTRFPAADIRIYLHTLAAQDPETWGALVPIASELLPS